MASRTRPADLLRQLDPGPAADAELLRRFVAARDQAAFAELVRRHGPVVLGVLRRVTGHPQDAEDAFQAVFLTLARKAGAVGRPELLGNWLYGVAVRVGRRARRSAVRRRRREVPAVNAPEPAIEDRVPFEAGPELYEELDRLPAWYRDAVLLCDLQGLSRAAAAKRLGIPEGTLSSRLAGGRKRLADALARRGVVLSAAGVPAVLGEGRGTAAVPDDLITRTCGLVADWAAGGGVPGPVVRLADGGISMRQAFLAGAFGLAVATAGVVAAGRGTDDPPKTDDSPKVAEKPAAKAEPKAEGKGVALTDRPRLRRAVDLNVPHVNDIIWSPDGAWIALPGPGAPPPPKEGFAQGQGPPGVTFVRPSGSRDLTAFRVDFDPENARSFVGFTPDGKQFVSARREYDLLSGRHELFFWGNPQLPDAPLTGSPADRIVDLDPDRTTGFVFSPDLATYRTIHIKPAGEGASTVEVWEVSLKTDRRLRTLLSVEGDSEWVELAQQDPARLTATRVALSPDGRRLAVYRQAGSLAVYDLTSGKELWRIKADGATPENPFGGVPQSLAFSPDAALLAVIFPDGRPAVLDAGTGAARSTPEGGVLIQGGPDPIRPTFTADGRLLAAYVSRLMPDPTNPKAPAEPQGQFVTVWDTATGKVVRTWPVRFDGPQVFVRFHPRLPTLAMAEQHGDKVRVGLWDFAADEPEKR
jgi:RNA polymerase sigma factor (sigma-70 family)